MMMNDEPQRHSSIQPARVYSQESLDNHSTSERDDLNDMDIFGGVDPFPEFAGLRLEFLQVIEKAEKEVQARTQAEQKAIGLQMKFADINSALAEKEDGVSKEFNAKADLEVRVKQLEELLVSTSDAAKTALIFETAAKVRAEEKSAALEQQIEEMLCAVDKASSNLIVESAAVEKRGKNRLSDGNDGVRIISDTIEDLKNDGLAKVKITEKLRKEIVILADALEDERRRNVVLFEKIITSEQTVKDKETEIDRLMMKIRALEEERQNTALVCDKINSVKWSQSASEIPAAQNIIVAEEEVLNENHDSLRDVVMEDVGAAEKDNVDVYLSTHEVFTSDVAAPNAEAVNAINVSMNEDSDVLSFNNTNAAESVLARDAYAEDVNGDGDFVYVDKDRVDASGVAINFVNTKNVTNTDVLMKAYNENVVSIPEVPVMNEDSVTLSDNPKEKKNEDGVAHSDVVMKEVYKEESNMSDILMEIVNEDALSISGDIMNEGSITFTGALKEHIDEKRVTISDSAMEVDDTHDLDARKSANDAIVATDGAIDLTSDDDVIILDVSNNIVSMKTAIDLTLGSTVKQSDVTIDLTGDDGLSISDAALKHVTANVIDPDVAMEGVKGNIIYVSDVAKGVTVDDVVISSGVAKDSTNEDVNIPNLCMKPTNVEAGGTTGESTDGGGVSLTDAANAAVSDVAEYVNDDAFSSPEVPLKVLSTSQMARISIDQGLATEEANLRTHLTSIDSRRSRISHLHAVVQAKILHATTYDDVVEAVEALNPNSADAIDQIFHVEHVLMAWSSHIVTLKTKWSSITDPLEKFSGDDVDGIRKLRETVIRCRKEVRKYISLVASHRFKSVASESTEKLSFCLENAERVESTAWTTFLLELTYASVRPVSCVVRVPQGYSLIVEQRRRLQVEQAIFDILKPVKMTYAPFSIRHMDSSLVPKNRVGKKKVVDVKGGERLALMAVGRAARLTKMVKEGFKEVKGMSVWRLKLKLCLDVVSILCFLHDSRVYDVGLSLDNIVLDDQFKVRLIGLGDYQPKIGSSTPTPPCNAISITRDLHSLSTIFLEICGPHIPPIFTSIIYACRCADADQKPHLTAHDVVNWMLRLAGCANWEQWDVEFGGVMEGRMGSRPTYYS